MNQVHPHLFQKLMAAGNWFRLNPLACTARHNLHRKDTLCSMRHQWSCPVGTLSPDAPSMRTLLAICANSEIYTEARKTPPCPPVQHEDSKQPACSRGRMGIGLFVVRQKTAPVLFHGRCHSRRNQSTQEGARCSASKNLLANNSIATGLLPNYVCPKTSSKVWVGGQIAVDLRMRMRGQDFHHEVLEFPCHTLPSSTTVNCALSFSLLLQKCLPFS